MAPQPLTATWEAGSGAPLECAEQPSSRTVRPRSPATALRHQQDSTFRVSGGRSTVVARSSTTGSIVAEKRQRCSCAWLHAARMASTSEEAAELEQLQPYVLGLQPYVLAAATLRARCCNPTCSVL